MQDDDVLVGLIINGNVAMFGSLSENNIHKNLINSKC